MDTDAEGSVYIFLCFYLKGGEIIKHMNAEGKEIFTPTKPSVCIYWGIMGCVCVYGFCFVLFFGPYLRMQKIADQELNLSNSSDKTKSLTTRRYIKSIN